MLFGEMEIVIHLLALDWENPEMDMATLIGNKQFLNKCGCGSWV